MTTYYVLSRGFVMQKKAIKSLRATPSVWAAIGRLARKAGKSVSAYVDAILAAHVKERQKP
jgi:hypothetical protein